MEPIFTFVGILLGGGILGFIQFLISRSDSKDEKDNEVLKKLDENKEEINRIQEENKKEFNRVWDFLQEGDAINRRNRILDFNEELLDNKYHSHERFLNILDDIREYDEYCEKHPDFPNGRTIQASANIKKVYDRLFDKRKFSDIKEES